MSRIAILLLHALPIIGFVSALILLAQLVRQDRPPSSTIAWVLAIFLIPYIGVPLYIVFGGRKLKQMTRHKGAFCPLPRRGPPGGKRGWPPALEGEGGIFPLRHGNQLALLPTGEQAFAELMQGIESAQESIYVTTFILGNDPTGKSILDALARKARQGLDVRLLVDALGSMKVRGHLLAGFRVAGGKCSSFMPMLHLPFRGRANLRNHRKIVLVDRKAAIIGGMNLARQYMGPESDPKRWRDLSLTVRGPIVCDLYSVFRSDWAFAAKEELPPAEEDQTPAQADGVPLQLVPSGPDVDGDFLYDAVLSYLFAAEQRIWIVTPYFIPDETLMKGLCIAARRGVDVRIVVPRVSNHRLADMVRRSYLRQVQTDGGTVWLYRPAMLHGKVILIDDSWAVIGSMNMDIRSFFLNYEIALLAQSQQVTAELSGWVEDMTKDCEAGIEQTPVAVEFIEGVGRLLAPLL